MTRHSAYGLSTRPAGHWTERARCAQLVADGLANPDDWFPVSEGQEHSEVIAARLECARCPVWQECRSEALASDDEHGIWGGLTRRVRRALQGRAA